MNPYICTNCGFWQFHFEEPTTCPVCTDFRHTPPESGPWEFLNPREVAAHTTSHWDTRDGITVFWNEPPIGIGPSGFLIEHPDGNVFFDVTGWYNEAAREFIASRGGIKWLSASHPHAYGAAWLLQQAFAPQIVIQTQDLRWTNAFHTDCPFDERLTLAPGLELIHSGGHFDGHTLLYCAERRVLFAGDMIKFHFEDGALQGLSTHKAFNRRIPMSHAEVRRYRDVVKTLEFDTVYTSFESAPCNRDMVLRLFDAQLSGAPFFGPLPLHEAEHSALQSSALHSEATS